MIEWNEILYVFACAGHGCRLGQIGNKRVAKVLWPLTPAQDFTPLEYHLRMLEPSARIALAAGTYKQEIMSYLKRHSGFGHHWRNFAWIPENYRKPQKLDTLEKLNVPKFPSGAGAWLLYEKAFIKRLKAKGISIIIQTDGNKVGARPDIINKMLTTFQASTAEVMVAVYSDVDQRFLNKTDGYKRFDLLVDGKGYPKGYAPADGDVLAGWYIFRIESLARLWNVKIRNSIQKRVAQYPQIRQFWHNDKLMGLKIFEINMPLLLEFFRIEKYSASRENAELGIGLKTTQDIPACRKLFEKRQIENCIRH